MDPDAQTRGRGDTETKRNSPRPTGRKPVIGLAGGIGAGKSTVAAEFEKLGCLVLDSDRQAHEVLQQPEVIEQVRQVLGDPTLDPADRQLRRKIAQQVFGRPELVEKINGLIHPRVHAMRREAIERVQSDANVVAVVLDTPLLFEAGVDGECDVTVFVDAPLGQRLKRVAAGRGWDAAELNRRQVHQLALDAKRAKCDFVVRNDGPADELAGRVRDVLKEILSRPRD